MATRLLQIHQNSQGEQEVKVQPVSGYCDGKGNGNIEGFIRFCWDFFRVRLYHQQRKIAETYLSLPRTDAAGTRFRRMAVRSGHSVGKTTLVALLLLYEFCCLKRSCITSSPGSDAVKKGVWKDVETHLLTAQDAGKPLPGDYYRSPELRIPGDPTWWAYGFYTDRPERAQGKKHPRLSLYLDEGSGFEDWFWDAIDSSMSSGGARMLVTGNPLHIGDRFHRIFTEEAGHWKLMVISSLHSPCITVAEAWELWEMINNLSPELGALCRHQVEEKVEEPWHDGRPPKEVFDGLADFHWVKEKIVSWSRDLNRIRKRILGLFPSENTSKAFPSCLVAAAQAFWLEQEEEEKDLAKPPKIVRAGIDAAGDGPDYTVLSYLQGQRIHYAWATQEADSTEQVEMVHEWMCSLDDDNRPNVMMVDRAGVGKGLYDGLRKKKREHPKIWRKTRIEEFMPGETSPDRDGTYYMIDYCYFEMAKACDPSKPWHERIGIPPDDRCPIIEKRGASPVMGPKEDCCVSAHFTTRGYKEDVWDRKRLENKTELEARQAKSPDLTDAPAAMWKPVKRGKAKVL